MKNFLKTKILEPLLNQLRQGATPSKLSLSVAMGAAIGVMPLLGPATFLCVIVGAAFKLNQVALQVGNYVVYGLQLIGIPLFLRYGDILFGASPFSLSPAQIKSEVENLGVWAFTQKFAVSLWHGTVLWLFVTPIIVAVVYALILPFFKKWGKNFANK